MKIIEKQTDYVLFLKKKAAYLTVPKMLFTVLLERPFP